jgi:hypothetical protein
MQHPISSNRRSFNQKKALIGESSMRVAAARHFPVCAKKAKEKRDEK